MTLSHVRAGLRLSIALAVLAGASSGALASGDPHDPWVHVAPPGEIFEVDMPRMPTRTTEEKSTFVGTVEDVTYKARRGEDVFIVTRVDLPRVATLFMSDAFIFNRIRKSYLARGNGQERSYADVSQGGYEGKHLEFVRERHGRKEDVRTSFFLVHGQMLSFTGIVPDGASPGDVERFLGSMRIRGGSD